ncbi:hypothetical protein WJ60_07655 [Burkholderia ubonensis]|uniref:hypothetical protein n=1 Tax=Burkholderia ubonensis TaxID=101571 RepID=UPI000756785E|nr:hypothetical protein [Burkholderia ubonensis]KVM72366.1 hypothetical protein WJ60_07655 [Burkholderia ubonensis]
MTRLKINAVLVPNGDTPFAGAHRILARQGDHVVLFKLEPTHGKPFAVPREMANRWVNEQLVSVGPDPSPDYIRRPESEIPASHRAKRDALWNAICPLVTGEHANLIFDAGDRWRLLTQRAAEVGFTAAYLYRVLQRYWRYGQIPNALLPGYPNSGGARKTRLSVEGRKRGRPRKVVAAGHDPGAIGVNVTADDLKFIALSVKLCHLRRGMTLKESYDEMILHHYSTPEHVDGEVRKIPYPSNRLIQLPAYRYWAARLMEDMSLQKEVLDDVLWRKRLRGRAGRARDTTIGPADIFEIDATVGNFYLVSEFHRNHLIGRPVVYFVVDRRSTMIVGLHVGLSGPSWNAARMALYCAFSDKVSFCAQYGVTIRAEDWPAQELCNLIVADNAELLSRHAERSLQHLLHIDCNINPVGLPVAKGTVENKFATVNESVSWVPGAWKARALEHDARKDLDLRWDAALTLREFTQVLIDEVLFHNNAIAIPNLLTKDMIQAGVKPYRRDIYAWGLEHESGERARHADPTVLYRCLLPSRRCPLTDSGLKVDDLYYLPEQGDHELLLARARRGRQSVVVHYDENCLDFVYVADPELGHWSRWQLNLSASARYTRMRFEDMLELRASLQFAAHDAADDENAQKALKKQRQQRVVSGATSAKRAAPKPATNREYLNSTKANRQREVAMQNALQAQTPSPQESLAVREREAATKHRSQMRTRRNNIVALRRSIAKPEKT